MVPTLISLAHSRVLTAFFVHRKLQGSELISYFLASLGDFSWPFVSILTWPLTIAGIAVVNTAHEWQSFVRNDQAVNELPQIGTMILDVEVRMLRTLRSGCAS